MAKKDGQTASKRTKNRVFQIVFDDMRAEQVESEADEKNLKFSELFRRVWDEHYARS